LSTGVHIGEFHFLEDLPRTESRILLRVHDNRIKAPRRLLSAAGGLGIVFGCGVRHRFGCVDFLDVWSAVCGTVWMFGFLDAATSHIQSGAEYRTPKRRVISSSSAAHLYHSHGDDAD